MRAIYLLLVQIFIFLHCITNTCWFQNEVAAALAEAGKYTINCYLDNVQLSFYLFYTKSDEKVEFGKYLYILASS